MKLSKNLTLAEVTKSATAKRRGIPNEPTIEHLENLKAIAENVFQPMRDHFQVPINISSGYRSKELNDAIGGSLASQHSKGEALDIDCAFYSGLSNREVFEYIKDKLEFDQLIWEFGNESDPDWVHVSYKKEGRNRYESLVAYKQEGKTRYKQWMPQT
jgi:zinc D-Ala-D-Ala carboxypeptidase